MKYSLTDSYYRLLAENISYHILVFWNQDQSTWMTEDGLEIYDIYQIVPVWAMNLARLHFGRGKENYFCFTPNSWTIVEMFWPDEEEEENWYT